jgi:thiol:disulfide interchange protein
MKFLKLLFPVALAVILLASCGGECCQKTGQTSATETTSATDEVNIESLLAATPAADRIEVIDFYGTHRCVTCKAIEANTKLALAALFPEELKAGKITFRTVNVDDEANAAMAEAYQAAGTALYLNVVKDGKETHVDLTEQAFAKGRERDAWAEELKFFINLQQKEMGEM